MYFLAFTSPLHLEFLTPLQALGLFAALAIPIVWLGAKSLKSLGSIRKWVAVGMRLLVLLVFILIIGGVRWVRVNHDVEVLALRDISLSTQQVRDFPDKTLTTSLDSYLRQATSDQNKRANDRIGVISFGSAALIDAIPNTKLTLDSRAIRDPGNGTDAAAAIQLALATMHRDAMHRLLLVWDGNATVGGLDEAIAAAAAQHVPIDVMPLNYDVQHEVLVERFVAPSWKREDEPFSLQVILRSTNSTQTGGTLHVTQGDQPVDMDPMTPGIQPARHVTLQPGSNVEIVQIPPLSGSNLIHTFHATFEADHTNAAAGVTATVGGGNSTEAPGDTLLQNNTADAFTFVRGKGKVLYVDGVPQNRGDLLADALSGEGITLEHIHGADAFPRNMLELQNYDAVILANMSRGADGLAEDQQKMLASYVHDMGGGLVMIGGENTFGAGGWQGSKLEEVLPVAMDIPAQRQLPKGALVLVMHSCEFPEGNYWGEQCALKAVETLSAADEIGLISYGWGSGGSQWDFPLGPKGDGTKLIAAAKNMQLGDMPSFDDTLDLALHGKNGTGGLLASDARQKHVVIISDGDPTAPAQTLLNEYNAGSVSISTVSVYPHDLSDQGLPPAMRAMAKACHGRAYGPINSNFNQLPQIFIKEATVVRRNLIFEDAKGIPLNTAPNNSDLMKGLSSLPPITGMVLTGRKLSPQIEVPIQAGKNNDPVLAHWQAGLGKSVVWTSDAVDKWAAPWVASGQYPKFWAQVVRSVSRPPQSADFDVQTTTDNGHGHITVEALGKDSAFVNFLSMAGQVVGPDMKAHPVHLVQTGPGMYTGEFDANDPGNYVAVLNYRGGADQSGMMLSGLAVNSSPELRDLKSNDAILHAVAERTGGRVLPPFDAQHADLFNRDGLEVTSSPLPIWDLMIPVLLGLILLDVAVRRIAWDWGATKKLAAAVAARSGVGTTVRQVDTRQSLDALQRIRAEGAAATQQKNAAPTTTIPDASAKFEATGVTGDITQIVGGATNQPLPAAPKKVEPKGLSETGDAMGGLMAAKRRAQQKIKEKEQE